MLRQNSSLVPMKDFFFPSKVSAFYYGNWKVYKTSGIIAPYSVIRHLYMHTTLDQESGLQDHTL